MKRVYPTVFALVFTLLWVSATTAADWHQSAKLTASDGAFMDQFGASVSIDVDALVIGSRYDDGNQGSAYVFEKPAGEWCDMTETARLTASDGAANFQFGCSVAISGDVVVVGARGSNGYMGAAYVYVKPAGGWRDMTETAILAASDCAASKVFGSSVAICGDTVVVGADGDTDNGYKSGAAYVFEKPVGGWRNMTETAKLTAGDGAAYDDFGASVSISNDTVVVGANGDDLIWAGQGSAYIFVRPSGGWTGMTETAKLTASDGSASDYFGAFVSVEADAIAVGAPGVDISNDVTIHDVGRVYVFEKPAGGWATMTETAKLAASDGDANSAFGASLDIGLDTVAVGAWASNGYIGAVYIFEKSAQSWTDMTETAKLTAADGAAYDDFGYSVGISQETVVAGAHLDDDNGNASGSAYVFTASASPPDCDYLLQDSHGYQWCLDVILEDSVGLYMQGTCDTGTPPAKQGQALYNWSGHLAMKAEQGSDGQLIQYHMRWGQSGMWIDQTGAWGQVDVSMISSAGSRASFGASGKESTTQEESASEMLDPRETRGDEDYCLADSDGNLWYLYEIARDDRGIFFTGTCDAGVETLDVMATYVWPRSGLALTAYNGSAPNRLCSFRWYRTGQWINSSGAMNTLTIDYCSP